MAAEASSGSSGRLLRACVVGYPVRHSRSPLLHGYWIKRYGLDASYGAEEIAPDAIAGWLENFADHALRGCNVTIPHKEVALRLSSPDARAKAVGAANTLWLEDGQLKSTNTDVEGFIGALDAASPTWKARTRSAVVLGAGGASRAVIYGLREAGVEAIHVINRTVAKAEALKAAFGAPIHVGAWSALPELLAQCDLLVNATSLGMAGHGALDVTVERLPEHAVVSDIVYVPLETPLLAAARQRGLATANGLDMLLHQAVRGFELWFGVRPEVTPELYDLLAADIEGR